MHTKVNLSTISDYFFIIISFTYCVKCFLNFPENIKVIQTYFLELLEFKTEIISKQVLIVQSGW